MARTLIYKTSREHHTISTIVESRMLIEQASLKAAKALREEDKKLKPSTITSQPSFPKVCCHTKQEGVNINSKDTLKMNNGLGIFAQEDLSMGCDENNRNHSSNNPSSLSTSNMRDELEMISVKGGKDKVEADHPTNKPSRSPTPKM